MSEQQFQEQQNKKTSFNLLLGAGIAFIQIGVFLVGLLSSNTVMQRMSFHHLIWAVLGGCLLFISIVKVRKKSMMFSGLFLVMTGTLLFFISINFIPFGLDALWPLVMVICGVSLLVSDFFVQRRVKVTQLIPAIALILMGVCCLLFSLDIVQQSFLHLASRWWPVVLIAAGICLVILFFIWNKCSIQLEDADDFSDLEDRN